MKGGEDDINKCNRNYMPMKYQVCYNNCYAVSCLQLKLIFGIDRDGEYNLSISKKIIKVNFLNLYLSLEFKFNFFK